MKNLNEIFRKDVTYDKIKIHKKAGFHRDQIDPSPAAVLGLKSHSYV